MGTLFVDRKNTALDLQGAVLAVRAVDAPVRAVPLELVDRVVLRGDVRLSARVLTGLALHGVPVTMIGGRKADRVAFVTGVAHADVRLRVTQVRRLDDEVFNRTWCARVVHAKLRGQRRLLKGAMERRRDVRVHLLRAVQRLDACTERTLVGLSVDGIRGVEGAGAAAYFRAFTRLFPPSLGFATRVRRPPTDPVNACLSLGYTLLYGLAVEACHAQGLDPMLGYLHRPAHGRASMACDLMEPWRTKVDLLVWRLFRQRRLRAEHFGRERHGACLLNKEGRARLYPAWAMLAQPLARAMRRHARLAVGALGDLAPAWDDDGVDVA